MSDNGSIQTILTVQQAHTTLLIDLSADTYHSQRLVSLHN